jgi:hypothetical protein
MNATLADRQIVGATLIGSSHSRRAAADGDHQEAALFRLRFGLFMVDVRRQP